MSVKGTKVGKEGKLIGRYVAELASTNRLFHVAGDISYILEP